MPEDQESQTTQATETDAVSDDFDKDRALATIKKLREFEKQAKAQAKELDDLRAKTKQAEDAKLSEQERLAKRVAELEQAVKERETLIQDREARLTETRRAALVARLAGNLGARDTGDANILAATAGVDPNAETAEADAKRAIEALKKAKPYLFGGAGGVEPFNPPAGGQNGATETDAQRRMRLYGGGGNIFDVATGRAAGGGVIIAQPLDAPVPKR